MTKTQEHMMHMLDDNLGERFIATRNPAYYWAKQGAIAAIRVCAGWTAFRAVAALEQKVAKEDEK